MQFPFSPKQENELIEGFLRHLRMYIEEETQAENPSSKPLYVEGSCRCVVGLPFFVKGFQRSVNRVHICVCKGLLG